MEQELTADSGEDLLGDAGAEKSGGGSESGESKLQSENARLSQRITNLQELHQKALPWVKVAKKLEASDAGREIIRKLQNDEPLTLAEEKKVSKESQAESKPVTKKDLEELERRIAERRFVEENSREARRNLDNWASEQFPGYDKIKKSPTWQRRFTATANVLLEDVENGEPVPDEYEDVWHWAVAETWSWVKSQNPDLDKETRVRDSKEEREAKKRAATTRSSTSPEEESSEIPEDKRKEIERIRRLGSSTTVGKSFSNPSINR